MSDRAAQIRDAHNKAMEALAADVHPYAHGAIGEWEKVMDAALDALVAERDEANSEADKWCDRADQAEMHQRAAEAEWKSLAAERRETVAGWEREGLRMSAENRRLREALKDFADHGTRFDCNPTVMVYNTPEWVASQEWWQKRATEMDVAVRNRARAALGDA